MNLYIEKPLGNGREQIDSRSSVRFQIDRHRSITIRWRDGMLEVTGTEAITIEPRAANNTWVRLRP